MPNVRRRRSSGASRSRRIRRRPMMRTRFYRRSRGDQVVSAQAGNIVSTRYRGGFLRRKRYQAALIRETLFQPHYRSLLTTSFTQLTPVGVNAATKTGAISLLPTVNPFWTVAGGALPIDDTIGVPTFDESSIVLRGGRTEVTVAVPGNDAIRLRVYLLWFKENTTYTAFNALTSVPTMWDPSHFTDWNQTYKIISSKEYILLPASRPLSLIHKLKPEKIDFNAYTAGQKMLVYCFTMQQVTDVDVLPGSVIFTVSHSLSFTGDSTA